MIYVVATLIALAVAGLVMLMGELVPDRPEVVKRLERMAGGEAIGAVDRRRREAQAGRLRELLAGLGTRLHGEPNVQSKAQRLMVAAGFVRPGSVAVFYGARIATALIFGFAFLTLSPMIGSLLGLPRAMVIVIALWGVALGWVVPTFLVAARGNARKREMLRALPDALDLLVVCVEAGLGLNQALQRVAEEITLISPVLGEQLGLVNLEIRAGTPRDEALRAFGTRTDLEDARSLATVLI